MKAEIFVLNYNGKELLEECLPSIVEAARRSERPCNVSVIDNHSADDSVEYLKSHFPGVNIIARQDNPVFCAYNDAVENSDADVVILLNNDLKTKPDFIDPLLTIFEIHPDAFLAAPKAFTFDGSRYEGSLSKFVFRYGVMSAESRYAGYESRIERPGITMQSGFGAFRRDLFIALGGFDDLYFPGTAEDTDLCFRAWRAGYTGYYVPKSRIYHKGQVTFRKEFRQRKMTAINQRNLHLFIWKNIRDPRILAEHLVWMLVRPVVQLFRGKPEFFWAFFWALTRLPAAIRKRTEVRGPFQRTDREILELSGSI